MTMRTIFVAVFLALFVTRAEASPLPPPDGDTLKIESLQRTVDELRAGMDSIQRSSDRKIQQLNEEFGAVATLAQRINILEGITKEKDKAEAAVNQRRFKAGNDVLKEMSKNLEISDFITDLLNLRESIDSNTNIWSDPDIRNGWDWFNTWGTIGGGLVAAATPILSADNPAKPTLYAGIGLAAVAQLAGRLLGNDYADRGQQKLEFINVTRKAYEDALVRIAQTNEFLRRNSAFADQVNQYRNTYVMAGSLSDTLQKINQVITYVDEYNGILNQVPRYLTEMKFTFNAYQEKFSRSGVNFDRLIKRIDTLLTRYEKKVRPILDLTPELRRLLVFGA